MDLSALQSNPQLEQLRQLVQQDPNMIQPLIQQIAASNPQLAQALASNPEALLQLLGGDLEGEEGGDLPPNVIEVTPEENAAIDRVSVLLGHLHS